MRRFILQFRRHFIALIWIVVFGFSPFIPVIVAGVTASANGCQLDEGSAHPCVILGHDFGQILYELGVMGWFGLATIPAAAFLLLLWVAWVAVSFFSSFRTARR